MKIITTEDFERKINWWKNFSYGFKSRIYKKSEM